MTTIIGPDNFFKESYVINLAKRKDRYHEFESMISQQNIGKIERFEAITDRDGANGCAQSHQAIIKLAKQKRLENVLIFEDDAMFVDNLNQVLLPALIQLMSKRWNLFYFGGRLISPAKRISTNLAKVTGIYCTHAYAVNQSMYDMVLNYQYRQNYPIDVFYADIVRDFESYTCYPIASYQRPGVSDLMNSPMDYCKLFDWSYNEFIK